MSDDAKRAALNIRTTTALKERLQTAGEASGRTMSQEADLRLEQSFAREDEAGSRGVAILGDFTRLAASIIEGQTGKSWTDDADTFFQVSKAIRSFMAANHPPDNPVMAEMDDALAELRQLGAAVDEQGGWRDALIDKPADAALIEAHSKALERTQGLLARRQEAMERNEATGKETADTLGHIFRLQPAKQPTKSRPTGAQPMPRVMRVRKRAKPHSSRQRA